MCKNISLMCCLYVGVIENMVCYKPLSAFYSSQFKTKKGTPAIEFYKYDRFSKAEVNSFLKPQLLIPCGRCIGCRLDRSRRWAVRCLHEAEMHENNIFVTLTYSDDNLPKDGSLHYEDFQLFMKRLRKKYVPVADSSMSDEDKLMWYDKYGIRFFMCGEYGDKLSRPHYHVILFNCDFKDREFYKTSMGNKLYTSSALESLWGKGFAPIGDVTFESAAYVSRYIMKKVYGEKAKEFYADKVPEFSSMSRKPGIAGSWFDKYKNDIFPHDVDVYINSDGEYRTMKPNPYFDKLLEKIDPVTMKMIKDIRMDEMELDEDDFTFTRLLDKEKCKLKSVEKLTRCLHV